MTSGYSPFALVSGLRDFVEADKGEYSLGSFRLFGRLCICLLMLKVASIRYG